MGLFDKFISSDKKRNITLRDLSKSMGLSFEHKHDYGMHQQLSEFRLFKVGGSREVLNVISEPGLGFENHLFDYKYVVSTGKTTQIFKQTVLFINSKKLSLPEFYQKPETIFTRLMAILGFDDIDFTNHEEYSKAYHLKGDYEEVIRYYFSDEVLDLLNAQKDLYVEGMNYYLILYQKNKLCPPEQLNTFRNLGLILHKLFIKRTDNIKELTV
jgi:hypothetical protein